jgi:hypothetical protein
MAEPQKAESGLRFGWLILVFALIALTQPIYLLVAWYFKIEPSVMTTANELSPILGSVFTAGGLIIALVSIYTMANVEAVANRTVERRLEPVPAQIKTSIRNYLEAYGYFTEAQDLLRDNDFNRLPAAERLLRTATTHEPDLVGLYPWAGRAYYTAAACIFSRQRSVNPLMFPEARCPDASQFAGIVSKANWWLTGAYQRDDGDHREIAMQLAEVLGMTHGDLGEVLRWLQAARDDDGRLPFVGNFSKLFLFGACKDESDIDVLASRLEMNPSLSVNDIKEYIAADVGKNPRASQLPIIAIPRPIVVASPPPRPGIVGVRYVPSGEGTAAQNGFASWYAEHNAPGPIFQQTYPRIEERPADAGGPYQPMMPIDDLLKEIAEMFFLIAPWRSAYFPER